MKTKIILLLAIISIAFTACNLEGESNYVPEIFFAKFPTNNLGDSLDIYYTDEAGSYRLDTITVGDTISFQMYITGYENNLTAFYLKESADSVTKIILPSKSSMDSIFLPTSNYNTGKFFMKGLSTSLYFPFKYVAKEPSNEAKIVFTAVSNSHFEESIGTNTVSFTLKTPIAAKPED